MFKSKHLAKRPFLVITTMHRPAAGTNTSVGGWGDQQNNWASFESATVVDRVKSNVMSTASVIIDILNSELVKNRYADSPAEEVIAHYLSHYKREVTEALDIWMNREAVRRASAQIAADTP